MLHTSSATAERRRPLSLSRRVPLLLVASVLAACAPDVTTAPPIELVAPKRPAVNYKEFSPSEIEAMLGRARLDTHGWRVLATVAPVGPSGVAYTAGVDTLIGYVGLSISGTSAQANAYAHATAHNGIPSVWMDGEGSTQIGIEIPLYYSLHCDGWNQGHPWWCGDAVSRTVNCDDPSGSNIEGTIRSYVWYDTGAIGDGTAQDSKNCAPSGGGSGGTGEPRTTGGGSSGNCQYYIIERSDDGGLTWYRIGAFRICDN